MNIVPEMIKKDFDETLVKNLERNVGASQKLAGLTLNLATVSSLVLLVEKESELEMDPSDAPERFTKETFLDELEDLGYEANEDVQREVQAMVENGYIVVESDGSFLAQEPTMEAVSLLDKAFPGMPGMNLVAYLAQTLEEAISGRKDPQLAIMQLDQTLQMHGGSSQNQTTSAKPSTSKKPALQSADALKSALSATLRKRQAQAQSQKSVDSAGQPKIVTASGAVKNVQVQEVFGKKNHASGAPGESLEEKVLQEPLPAEEGAALTEDAALFSDTGDHIAAEDDHKNFQKSPEERCEIAEESARELGEKEDTPPLGTDSVGEASSDQETSTSQPEALDPSPESASSDDDMVGQTEAPATGAAKETTDHLEDMASMSEEALAERISAFEQDLAMTCPACGEGKINEQETAKGKVFYACNRQECVFVSWGKPYHLECPWCKNPFLVEVAGKNDKKKLKCPRATCKYKQGMPGETESPQSVQGVVSAQSPTPFLKKAKKPRKKKRVVRRRVVRRKR